VPRWRLPQKPAKPTTGRRYLDAAPAGAAREVALKRITPTEFSGEIVFKDVLGYQVRVQRGKQTPGPSLRYGLRTLPDQPPQLTLTGLDRQTEAQLARSCR